MPTSGEVRINGLVFINNKPATLKPQSPVIYQPQEAGAVRQAVKSPQKRKAKPSGKHLNHANKSGVKPGKAAAPTVAGRGTSQERAKLAKYWAAHPSQYNQWAHEHHKNYTDCGVFIGKVMRDSGSDPNYPAGSTGVQWDYVHNPNDGWTIGKVGEDGGPQPGDVLLRHPYLRRSGNTYGHTGLYVGQEENAGSVTHDVTDEASLGGHGPEERPNYTDASLAHTYQIWARPPSKK